MAGRTARTKSGIAGSAVGTSPLVHARTTRNDGIDPKTAPRRPGQKRVVQIRPVTSSDAVIVAGLRGQLEEIHASLLPGYFRVSTSGRAVFSSGPWSKMWVADVDRVVRGYVLAKIVDTPSDPVMIPSRRIHVVEIGVDKPSRRGGLGAQLMRAALDWGKAEGAEDAVLTVWSDNRAALGLYKTLGFEPIARVMRRSLASNVLG